MELVNFSKNEELGIIKTFLNRVSRHGTLDSLSLEEITGIKNDVKLFKENPSSKVYHYRVEIIKIIHFLNQYVISARYRPDQEIAFLILAIDPTFKMIQYYTDDKEQSKDKIQQEFGVFNLKILKLEILFYRKYMDLRRPKETVESVTSVSKEAQINESKSKLDTDDKPPRL